MIEAMEALRIRPPDVNHPKYLRSPISSYLSSLRETSVEARHVDRLM